MNEQDIITEEERESAEAKGIRQQLEVERLASELLLAKDRTAASLQLTQTVVGTVAALAHEIAGIANSAFDLTESVESVLARTNRVMRELHYVQAEAETGQLDTAAARLLARQLRDIAIALDLQIETAMDADIQQMRDQGQEERREVEDRQRGREDVRRHEEDDRREREDSIFEDPNDSGMG